MVEFPVNNLNIHQYVWVYTKEQRDALTLAHANQDFERLIAPTAFAAKTKPLMYHLPYRFCTLLSGMC